MKLASVALLVAAMLCNSMLVMAESPVPFRALMQTAGAQPSASTIRDANGQSAAVSTPPAPRRHMTTRGKIMIGVGIGLVAIGGVVMAATPNAFATSTDKNELYGASGATMGVGALFIVLGARQRSAQ